MNTIGRRDLFFAALRIVHRPEAQSGRPLVHLPTTTEGIKAFEKILIVLL